MELIKYTGKDALFEGIAQCLTEQLREALGRRGTATLAVPGGTTPGPIFDRLAQSDLDWSNVHVMLTDERWVERTSERSNTRLIFERLLTGLAAKAKFEPICAAPGNIDENLGPLEDNLALHLPLDVCLLGMGADLHTASIFPGADNLQRALEGEDLLIAMRAPGAPEPRVTVSAKVLCAAGRRHLVILGQDKLDALDAAEGLPPTEAPVNAILNDTTVHWAKS